MSLHRRSVVVLLLAAAWVMGAGAARAADLQSQVRAMIDAADLRSTQMGVLIVDLNTGRRLAAINADEPLIPASNMKLVTTAAAIKVLGPQFVFRTELRHLRSSDWGQPSQGQPAGSAAAAALGHVLLIKGDGDPGLGDPELLRQHDMDAESLLQVWVRAVKAAGIDRVERLIVDDRVFERTFVHPSWPAEQLSAWYCAEVGGINFYDNCIDVLPEPTQRGQGARVKIMPAAPFLSVSNRAVTGAVDRFWVNRKAGTNELVFSGEVKTRRTEAINVTIHDPPLFFARLLASRLAEAGVRVGSIVRPSMEDALPAGKTILTVENTLPLVVQRCNKDSQNLFAEALFKRMGRAVTGAPGSWENGAAAVRLFLRDHIGAEAASIAIADGSGMSRDNRVTPEALVNLLKAMREDPKAWPIYRDSLSIEDSGGSLKGRFRSLSPKLNGVLYPKTGYINGVCSLSGYLVLPDPAAAHGERTLAFSLIFNDFRAPTSLSQIQTLQDRLVSLLDRQAPAPARVGHGG